MSSLLLAESGSTKTDWCLLNDQEDPVHFKTSGINPYLQTRDEINEVLHEQLNWDPAKHKAEAIFFYGAGAGAATKQQEISEILKTFFNVERAEVQGDMMAAARAMCGNKSGIVSILGTGSNSCYYNGSAIEDQLPSLGFIAGDEGSGNNLGKKVLQYYAYKTFDEELINEFERLYGNDLPAMLHKLYKEPFPNRYLATFVKLLTANRGHYMIENIIEDSLNDFFNSHILKYRQSWTLPLYFTGSVSFEFKDIIESLCYQYELELGKIEKEPIKGLLAYHRALL